MAEKYLHEIKKLTVVGVCLPSGNPKEESEIVWSGYSESKFFGSLEYDQKLAELRASADNYNQSHGYKYPDIGYISYW